MINKCLKKYLEEIYEGSLPSSLEEVAEQWSGNVAELGKYEDEIVSRQIAALIYLIWERYENKS